MFDLPSVAHHPWAIDPAAWPAVQDGFLAIAQGQRPLAGVRDSAPVLGKAGQGVAVMTLFGVLLQRDPWGFGVSMEQAGRDLNRLANDAKVGTIVLVIDSPGGEVFGTQELGSKIRQAAKAKHVIAMVDSVAASAAYWLASQASEVVITPGGQVGSIGIIVAHVDVSEAEQMAGLKTTVITSSRYKAELDPSKPLSDEARADLQKKVDEYHQAFVADVARGRGVSAAKVEANFGQGRMLLAEAAKKAGMADRVATLEQVLRGLRSPGDTSTPWAARRAVMRARLNEVEEEERRPSPNWRLN